MFNSFFKKKHNKISFEHIQHSIHKGNNQYVLINTLSNMEQDCLIQNTLSYQKEESFINTLMENYNFHSHKIIVYGKNNNDPDVEAKYNKLCSLGFTHVFMYVGGLFEWLLLQDIYGKEEFPTTTNILDILKYKPSDLC